MNLEYQNILILNGVLGVTAQNRLYCRKSSWFVRGAFRPRGSSTTTTDRRTNARPMAAYHGWVKWCNSYNFVSNICRCAIRMSYDTGCFITERLIDK